MTDFRPSGFEQRKGERRAPETQPMPAMQPDPTGWHLDKKVPITLIVIMMAQFVAVIIWLTDLKKDVELLKQDTTALHVRDSQQADSFREALKLMQDQFSRMDSKLDRLIERQNK